MSNVLSENHGLIFDEVNTNEVVVSEIGSIMESLQGYQFSILSESDGKGQIRDLIQIALDQTKVADGMSVAIVNLKHFERIISESKLSGLGLCEVFTETIGNDHLVVNALLRVERYSL